MTRARRFGAMVVLAACFLVSATVRFADPGFAEAIAAETAAPKNAAGESTEVAESRLLAELMERSRQLDEREKRIARMEQTISEAQDILEEKLRDLEAAEARLASVVEVASTAAETDISKLVAAYQAMDGKAAAAIFQTMDTRFAAGLLSRMRDEPAAGILAQLPPDVAYAITAHIAGRNALAPKE